MSTTIKNAKTIQYKSRTHQVESLGSRCYKVTSGATGQTYRVQLTDQGGFCTCDWAKYRPASDGHRSGCSHVIAAANFQANLDGRTVMAWASTADAQRQHRPTLSIGDGVTLTTRQSN